MPDPSKNMPTDESKDYPMFSLEDLIAEGEMTRSGFHIGLEFYCGGKQRWRCTDVGTRVIVAIMLEHEDNKSWYNGPPYAVSESVFDEYSIMGCSIEPPDED